MAIEVESSQVELKADESSKSGHFALSAGMETVEKYLLLSRTMPTAKQKCIAFKWPEKPK